LKNSSVVCKTPTGKVEKLPEDGEHLVLWVFFLIFRLEFFRQQQYSSRISRNYEEIFDDSDKIPVGNSDGFS
jgi:hypothetical protein